MGDNAPKLLKDALQEAINDSGKSYKRAKARLTLLETELEDKEYLLHNFVMETAANKVIVENKKMKVQDGF